MKWKEREEQLKNLLSAEQDAGASVGISRDRKALEEKWPLEVRIQGLPCKTSTYGCKSEWGSWCCCGA